MPRNSFETQSWDEDPFSSGVSVAKKFLCVFRAMKSCMEESLRGVSENKTP